MILRCILFLYIATIGGVSGQASLRSENGQLIDEHGAIIRGDVTKKAVAIVFTGDEYADGDDHVRETLRHHGVRASFFLTGRFYANAHLAGLILQGYDLHQHLNTSTRQHLTT